eukprot:GILI01012072.1.p1 GENE.GILI01012072.1~~GILI01012072.1.p1  ORF type:complete len:321 (+),score=28.98 GILI01012072.1:58-963(+)
MDRPRSSTKSLASCSPSGVPTPLSITPHGIRRSHLTPTLVDGDLSLSKIERLSPHQRTPTSLETGTPRLAAAVSEAKRVGAAAPSPACSDVPMDQFDRMLSKNVINVRLSNTPSQTPLSAREDTSSPSAVSRAVQNVISDEFKRRELLISLQKLFQDAKGTPPPALPARGSRNNTPHHNPSAQAEAVTFDSIIRLAKVARDVSPVGPCSSDRLTEREFHSDPITSAFTQAPKKGICRPKPTTHISKSKQLAEGLALRDVPSSQKILKSELSAFSETTESSSLTSYSTSKSAKQLKEHVMKH